MFMHNLSTSKECSNTTKNHPYFVLRRENYWVYHSDYINLCYHHMVSSVSRVPDCCVGIWGFKHQTGSTLRVKITEENVIPLQNLGDVKERKQLLQRVRHRVHSVVVWLCLKGWIPHVGLTSLNLSFLDRICTHLVRIVQQILPIATVCGQDRAQYHQSNLDHDQQDFVPLKSWLLW